MANIKCKAFHSRYSNNSILCIGGTLMIWVDGKSYMLPNPETYRGYTMEIIEIETSLDDTPEQMLEKIKEAYANATKE